jgi:UDP-glucose 4-epimerase
VISTKADDMTAKTVLVVGGCGFLGRAVVQQFLKWSQDQNVPLNIKVFDIVVSPFVEGVEFLKGKMHLGT